MFFCVAFCFVCFITVLYLSKNNLLEIVFFRKNENGHANDWVEVPLSPGNILGHLFVFKGTESYVIAESLCNFE